MNVSTLIAAIPRLSDEERRRMRENALAGISGTAQRAPDAKAVLEAIDAFETKEQQRFKALDVADRIAEAFRRVPMSPSERLAVQVLLDHPGASSDQLSGKAGWRGQSSWHLRFGTMCRDRGHLLWPGPFEEKRKAEFYSGMVADFDEQTRGFILKPEAVEAFTQLGLRPRGTR